MGTTHATLVIYKFFISTRGCGVLAGEEIGGGGAHASVHGTLEYLVPTPRGLEHATIIILDVYNMRGLEHATIILASYMV